MDPVAAQNAARELMKMTQQGAAPGGPAGPASQAGPAPAREDVAAFEKAMSVGAGEGQGLDVGQQMFDQVKRAGVGMRAEGERIRAELDAGDLGPADLLRLQFDVAKLTMDQTLLGKVGEKSGQSIQTLFRGQ